MQWGDVVSPEAILKAFPEFGLFEIPAEDFAAGGFKITRRRDEGEDHVAVWGLKSASNSTLEKLRLRITRAWEPVTQQMIEYQVAPRSG